MRKSLPTIALTAVCFLLPTFSGCNHNSESTAAPPSPLDTKINNYEKTANEYVRVAKKLKDGDVSITVKYIQLEERTKNESARLHQEEPRMTPQQAQRLADISAKTAPYLKQ